MCKIVAILLILSLGSFIIFSPGSNTMLRVSESNVNKLQTQETVEMEKEEINIKNYGAKGDGVTDDTTAIQNAINVASINHAVLFIPESDGYYKITGALLLQDNTHISGYGATIFMPSQDSPKVMLKSGENNYISNVTIEGIALKSNNDKNGNGYQKDSLTSNVIGIGIQGINSLTIKDVLIEDMYVGLKLGASLNGIDNFNINVDNLQIINSSTPLLMGATNGFTMTNSILDADAGNSRWLHAAYIDWGNSHLRFENTRFINAPGSGVNIGAGDETKKSPTDMTFNNCTIENCNRGFNMYITRNVTVSNTSITKCNLAFALSSANNIEINNVGISQAKVDIANANIATDKGSFYIRDTNHVQITDVTVDANGMGGSLFSLLNKVEDTTISSLTVTNMNDIGFFYNNSVTDDFIVENSNFEWTKITNPRLSFRGAGANAIFRNNTFINKGNLYLAIADNYINTHILLENNSYSGFQSLANESDYSIIKNNLNLDTNIVDGKKGFILQLIIETQKILDLLTQ